jgi:hypothetical protein
VCKHSSPRLIGICRRYDAEGGCHALAHGDTLRVRIPGTRFSLLGYLLRRLEVMSIVLLLFTGFGLRTEARVIPVPVPKELRSVQYQVQVNGKPVDVAHAAASYDYVSIEATLCGQGRNHRFR